MQLLASGYGLLEGPRMDSSGNLFFSDVTEGGVYRLTPHGTIEVVVPKRRGVGGIAIHADGGLIISGRNVCSVRKGETRVLLEVAGVGGFNDLFTDERGRIIVGSLRSDPFGPRIDHVPGEVYRIGLDGSVEVLYGEVGLSNGIGLSPDARILYHCDSLAAMVIAHDIDEMGVVGGRRIFAKLDVGLPDGLAVDEEGCVWIATYTGGTVQRYMPDGSLNRVIEIRSKAVTSLCFAGPDRKDLIVVTADNTEEPRLRGSIFSTRVKVAGLRVPLARV